MNGSADLRVLHVISDLEYGGAQESLCVLAETKGIEGCFFHVCSLADGPLRARLEASGIPVDIIPAPSCTFSKPFRYLAELKRIRSQLAAVLQRCNIDLVQTHILNFLDLPVIRLRRRGKVRAVIWTFHGPSFLPARPGPTLGIRKRACSRMYRSATSVVDAIVVVSEEVRRAVLAEIKPPRHKLHVIGNAPGHSKWESARSPAEVRTGLGISLNAKIILFIGRLADVKGCDLLIHALPGILADLPETVCVVAGSGPAEESLQNLASSLGIQEQIKFLGSRKDIAELLAAADVFCLPSREEGMSLALLEAMSAGKPIVASGIAANRAVITQNTTGMLVPPEDAGALRQALLDLLAHPDKAARLGTAAQAYALSTYNAQAQRETYDRLYRKLLSARICE